MKYLIFNATDQVIATNETFTSVKKAKEKIEQLRKQFNGYYLTNNWERISPDDISYHIIEEKIYLQNFWQFHN